MSNEELEAHSILLAPQNSSFSEMKGSCAWNIDCSVLIFVFFLTFGFFSRSNLRFLMIAMAYAVPTGVIAGWTGVLDMILTPAKVSQVGRVHRARVLTP